MPNMDRLAKTHVQAIWGKDPYGNQPSQAISCDISGSFRLPKGQLLDKTPNLNILAVKLNIFKSPTLQVYTNNVIQPKIKILATTTVAITLYFYQKYDNPSNIHNNTDKSTSKRGSSLII